MGFQIKRIIEQTKEVENLPVNRSDELIILDIYDGREISSTLGCQAKDLYCSRICVFTGKSLNPLLHINDYVLK